GLSKHPGDLQSRERHHNHKPKVEIEISQAEERAANRVPDHADLEHGGELHRPLQPVMALGFSRDAASVVKGDEADDQEYGEANDSLLAQNLEVDAVSGTPLDVGRIAGEDFGAECAEAAPGHRPGDGNGHGMVPRVETALS